MRLGKNEVEESTCSASSVTVLLHYKDTDVEGSLQIDNKISGD